MGGGHVRISKQFTNSTVRRRIAELEDFWQKLRHSKCSFTGKARAVRTVAWPRSLHAISNAPVGDSVWTELRRRTKWALSLDKAGVNSHLLGLLEFGLDPQYAGLLQTIKDARTFQPLDFCASLVFPCAVGALDLPPNSAAQIALTRVQQLGFHVTPAGLLRDRFGTFCLQTAHITEVELRCQWAWVQVVAHQVSHRSEFHGFPMADVVSTRKCLATLGVSDRSFEVVPGRWICDGGYEIQVEWPLQCLCLVRSGRLFAPQVLDLSQVCHSAA